MKSEIHVSREYQEVVVPETVKDRLYLFARCENCKISHYVPDAEIEPADEGSGRAYLTMAIAEEQELWELLQMCDDYDTLLEELGSEHRESVALYRKISRISDEIFGPYMRVV